MPKLCLTRYPGERIALTLPDGRVIWVGINEKRAGSAVRLIVEAPADVLVDREEVREARLSRKGVTQ
jgi:sRNA-binding carbon storage regulator CsrA